MILKDNTLKQPIMDKEFHLIQIVDKLPPSLYGIGDYAYQLASKLRKSYAVTTSFIVFDFLQENIGLFENFSVSSLSQSEDTLLDTVIKLIQNNLNTTNIIILHYDKGFYDSYINRQKFEIGYFPVELLNFINFLKKKNLEYKLIIVFHEFIYPLIERRRDFLLRPLQKFLMKKVIQSADIVVCSNPVVAKQLSSLQKKTPVFICPVFSNIGEPSQNPFEQKQEGTWVLFGSTETLIRTLEQFVYHLYIIINSQTININTVNILGGEENETIWILINEIKKHISTINYYPRISNRKASQIFERSQFCYMYYFVHNLLNDSALIFKSGVFSAACSHGVIPVFGNPGMENAIGVLEHPGFLFFKDGQFNLIGKNTLADLSKKLFYWYRNNSSIENAANTFYKAVNMKN